MKFFDKFKLILSLFFLFFIVIYFSYYLYKVSAQRDNQINFYVYPNANYRDLGASVEAGVDNLDTRDLLNKFYNVSPNVTVLDKSFYRLEIPATSNIRITFIRLDPSHTSTTINGNCNELGGSVVTNNICVIYGMISSTALSNRDNRDYELWKIRVNNIYEKYFYIVSSSTALDPRNRNDLYYLMPISTSVTLTDTNPSTNINYYVYYKKLYCASSINFPIAESYITSTSNNSTNGFGHFTVEGSEFGSNIYINKLLSINNEVNSGEYLLYLIKQGGVGERLERLSYNATITVENNITPPTISLTCSADPTTGLNIGSSTIYALTASSSQILGDSTFTLEILNTNNNSTQRINIFSGNINSTIASVATSVVWQATGTYYATGTVETSGRIRAQNSCPIVSIGECQCLYRTSTGGSQQRRCRSGGGWGEWTGTSESNIPRECNCDYSDVRQRYPDGC